VLVVASCSGDDGGESATSTTSGLSATSTTAAGPPVDVALEGPIEGGERGLPYNAMPEGVEDEYDYLEQEWFASGVASAYTSEAPLTADGRWTVSASDHAQYTTRIVVRKPADPADFNGVVLVEWLNVTAGRDSDPDFGFLHPEILREGYEYMAVSAQRVGIFGGPGRIEVPGVPAEALAPLQEWDPERYAPLAHPGDDYSYDLFAQMGALAEGRGDQDPFEGMDVTTVLAVGQSQSAIRLVTFANTVQPGSDVFDGLLVHSRGAAAGALSEAVTAPSGIVVRDDLEVPVLLLVTETDLMFLGYRNARQLDTARIVTWEVAGTAHADQSTLDYGVASGARWSELGGTIDLRDRAGRRRQRPRRHPHPGGRCRSFHPDRCRQPLERVLLALRPRGAVHPGAPGRALPDHRRLRRCRHRLGQLGGGGGVPAAR